MSRRNWMRFCLAGLLVLLMGCGTFPSDWPVQRADDTRASGRPPGIDVAAQPPAPGASPEAILEGFFSASEAPGDSYMVARQYLTEEAAHDWQPERGILVYEATGQSRVVTAEGQAVLHAPLVGRVDADHRFTAVQEPEFSHNFHMTQVDGEWRIGNPGPGVLMSRTRFYRAFQSVPVYYLDLAGDHLVAQQVFLRPDDVKPEGLVTALLAGPDPWLRLAVLNALPAELQTSGATIDNAGVAQVSLSQEIEALSTEQRLHAAAQLLYTLSYFEAVTGLQISVNGNPLALRGADADGVLRRPAVQFLAGERPPAARNLFGIREGSVVQVGTDAPAWVQPLPGELGAGWDDVPGQIAVSWQSDQVAVVNNDRNRLYLARTQIGAPALLHEGTSLARPQFDADGRLWTIDSTPAGPVALQYGTPAGLVATPLGELAGATVVAFEISPDLTRMAVIAQFGEVRRLGLLRLRTPDSLVIDGWRDMPVHTSRGNLTEMYDLAFVSADRLMVLGATARDPQVVVYAMDVDAAQVTSQGPIGDVDAISITAMPTGALNTVAVVTSTNRGLRYEAQYRWPQLVDNVTDLAYPS